jgi:trimeric autotransporter adhesin
MKKITLILFLLFGAFSTYSQNITNTLGTGGQFIVKDGLANYLTLNQSTGQVNILKTLRLENTTSPSVGVIFKGTDRFIHNYGTNNTFIGINSGNFTMTGSYNTALGFQSLSSNTVGTSSTAIGDNALYSNTTGFSNTATGSLALYSNTTGNYNTANGKDALYSNITGNENTANGLQALFFNTTGNYNTANGMNALYSNTTGNENTANGGYALVYNTIGSFNTANGYGALLSNTTGSSNTANGYQSLYSNTIGNYNTTNGYGALYSNTTGFGNTANGHLSLYSNTTGYHNTVLGFATGNTITTGNNLTCIGNNAQPTTPDAINQITLGNSSVTSLRCNVTTITSLSDVRDKKNIRDLNLGINFIMKLKPRIYNWDKREWYDDNKSDGSKMNEEPTAGFIAQELDEAQTTGNAEWLNLVLKDNPEKWEATPGNLFPVMVKAIQELIIKNEQLEFEKDEEIAELKTRLAKFEEMQTVLVKKMEQIESNKQFFKVQIVKAENNNQ